MLEHNQNVRIRSLGNVPNIPVKLLHRATQNIQTRRQRTIGTLDLDNNEPFALQSLQTEPMKRREGMSRLQSLESRLF